MFDGAVGVFWVRIWVKNRTLTHRVSTSWRYHEGYVITKPFGFVRPPAGPTTFNFLTSGSTFTEPGVYVMPLKVTSTSYTLISSVNNNNMADAQTWGRERHIVGSPNNKYWQSF